jgi:hypothetical protein
MLRNPVPWILAALSWLLIITVAQLAFGAAPVGADPTLAPFYQSLKQPGTGGICCSMADCRPVQVRFLRGRMQVFIGPQFPQPSLDWRDVPAEVVIHDVPNQAGEPIACWYGKQVRCFIDGGLS